MYSFKRRLHILKYNFLEKSTMFNDQRKSRSIKIYKNRVPYTKKNIIIRDDYECCYCGSHKNLTIDHVIPESRGGKTNFENCVAACFPCNNKKNNRTPREANMFMKKKPHAPTISEFFMLKMKNLGLDKYLKELGVY